MAPWAQDPSERPVRVVVPPLGLLGCGCLEGGVANTHGHHAIALRGVILVRPIPQMLAGRPQLHGLGNSNAWSKRPTWESTVLVRTRALSGNASVAAMQSFVVD